MSYIKRWFTYAAMLGLIIGGPTALLGCEDKSGLEEVGEDIDEGVEDMGDAVEDATD